MQTMFEALEDRVGESNSEITFKKIERSDNKYATNEPFDTSLYLVNPYFGKCLHKSLNWKFGRINLWPNLVSDLENGDYTNKQKKNDNISMILRKNPVF